MADGSIQPPTAPINRDGDVYYFTDNITIHADGIIIQKDGITIDGAGFTLQGPGKEVTVNAKYLTGIKIEMVSNVEIRNITITDYGYGVTLSHATNNNITNCKFLACIWGIKVIDASFFNIVSYNEFMAEGGIAISDSSHNYVTNNVFKGSRTQIVIGGPRNTVAGNNITGSDTGISIANGYWDDYETTSYNEVYNNNIIGCRYGMYLQFYVANNTIFGNTIKSCTYCIYFYNNYPKNNKFYHNNFIFNTYQIRIPDSPICRNIWDNGCLGGNYWSDYAYSDSNHDGFGDVPYIINDYNKDNYPLMEQYVIPEFSSPIIPLSLMITTLLVVIIYKKKNH
ncbi:MAG: NosD domain-containing protein [Candidatus Bathyarchaeia archaeon]